MQTFVTAFLLYTGLMLVLGIPVFVIARRNGQPTTARRFVVAAVVIGLLSGVVSFTSEQLVMRCEAAGNTACFDSGSAGLIVVFVAGYTIVAWVKAIALSRE